MPYAHASPNAPMITPASAGPAIIPNDPYVDWRANAAGRRGSSSRRGSRERSTG